MSDKPSDSDLNARSMNPETELPTTIVQRHGHTDELPAVETLPRPFGRYELRKRLGKGGMGTVYLAWDGKLDRLVALKVPHPEVIHSPAAAERFRREARTAAKLNHPNLCPVYDAEEHEGRPFITMPYVEGETLSARVTWYPGRSREIAALVRKLALAVAEAHNKGIIHRDLKPANVMMTASGEPIVMDFGLARQHGQPSTESSPGVVMGTPAYVAPEQALGDVDAVGYCSDVYAMGVILYELLTGEVPFRGPTTAVLVAVVKDPPQPPSSRRGDVDAILEGVCLKTMSKLPAQRYASMAEFAAILGDYLEGRLVNVPNALTPAETAVETILREFRAVGYERGCARALTGLERLEGLAEEGRATLAAWLRGEEGAWLAVQKRFSRVRGVAALTAWAELGQAGAASRRFHFPRALQRLERAAELATPGDVRLAGEMAYVRASVLARQGGWEEAALALHQALEQLGRDHPLMGAVLDLLGRVYAGKCNFRAACEFFQQAIAFKREYDDAGLAYSHEELGWLYVDYGQLDRAEEELSAGMHVAQRRGDELAEARLINHAGRVALARADREIEANNLPAARKWREKAQEDLDWAARIYQRTGQDVPEGRLRKYLALIAIGDGDLEAAESHLNRGKELLSNAGHGPGLAEVQEYTAYLRLAQNRIDEAVLLLRQALAEYDRLRLTLAGVRTQHQLARTLARIKVPKGQVIRAYEEALRRAEACRRGDLVGQLERELGSIDPELVSRHLFRRVRGHGVPEGVSSLNEGTSDAATVLCLELVDFEGFCQGLEPEAVMWTLNQLLADLQGVLDRHKAQILTYLGGGFLALLRETGHAERAVEAALDLRATMAEFNRPRGILDLPLLPARIGLATGLVFLGNIGTYRHLDFAAVGPPVNLAASLMRRAGPSAPTISQETYELVRDRFTYTAESPRKVDVTGIGPRQVYDVTGRGVRSGRSVR